MPVNAGYLMLSPLRKLKYNPVKMFKPFLIGNDTILDVGCAMGYFSIPLARMAGEHGKVICSDVQGRMLEVLSKRALKRKLTSRIIISQSTQSDAGLSKYRDSVDLAVIIQTIHEVRHYKDFLYQIHAAVKKDGYIYLSESFKTTSEEEFSRYVDYLVQYDYEIVAIPVIRKTRTVVLQKL